MEPNINPQNKKDGSMTSKIIFTFILAIIVGILLGIILCGKQIFPQFFNPEKQASVIMTDGVQEIPKEEIRDANVHLVFVGDIMLDRGVKNSVNKNMNSDFNELFQNTQFIKNADIAFANLEGPVSDRGRNVGSKYSFRFTPESVISLSNAGFDIVSIANNHAGDWTHTAFMDTMTHLKENNILYTGGGINKSEAISPTIIEKNGMKIGFLGFTDVGPNWLEATEKNGGILLASDPDFDTIVTNAKKDVDQLIVSFHWGVEYKPHTKRQTELAHRAIDAGATLIIGHHPHVVDGDTEKYKNGFIVYSLGNFIFDQYFSTETMEGGVADIVLSKDSIISTELSKIEMNKWFVPHKVEE